MTERLELQKKLTQTHKYFLFIYTIYMFCGVYIFNTIKHNVIYVALPFILLIIVDIQLAKKRYYDNFFIPAAIRTVEFLLSLILLYLGRMNFFQIAFYISIYLITTIEFCAIFELKSIIKRVIMAAICIAPTIVAVTIAYRDGQVKPRRQLDIAFLVVMFAMFIYHISKVVIDLVESHNKELNNLNLQVRISRKIGNAIDINELMDLYTDSIISEFDIDYCTMILRDKNIDIAKKYETRRKIGSEFALWIYHSFEDGSFERKFRNKETTYIEHRIDELGFFYTAREYVSSVMVQKITDQGVIIGYIVMASKKENAFKDSIYILEALKEIINTAMKNARLFYKIADVSNKDELSGLYNRRYLQKYLEKEIDRAKSENRELFVILYDIDNFKKINDTYGHSTGDKVICRCSEIGSNAARSRGGICARYGGEEFVIILSGLDKSDVINCIRQMHNEIKETSVTISEADIKFDVSIGIAEFSEKSKNSEELIKIADEAMYMAKQGGKGKIEVV